PVAPVLLADRDRRPAGHPVLSGGGVPPAVLQEEPGSLRSIPDRLREGPAHSGALGRPGRIEGSRKVKATAILAATVLALTLGSGTAAAQAHTVGWNPMTFKKP